MTNDIRTFKGRGAVSNATGRFESREHIDFYDGWDLPEDPDRPKTSVLHDHSKSVLTFNQSPDVPFDRSVNPYRGCEHGCVYCFARPTHAYLGLSPGLDFETQLFCKEDAAEQLERELRKSGYTPSTIALGVNTDAYQPAERRLAITRQVLETLHRFRHPVSIITKSALVERDLDLLAEMAASNLVSVSISITTLNSELARRLEPRAASPARRMRAVKILADAGIPTSVGVAPIIPVLTDPELESILEQAADNGAVSANYIMLRLPLEIAQLFEEWLYEHYPLKAEHVLKRVRDTQGGKMYDSTFGQRMRGSGPFADIIARRFATALQRHGLRKRENTLDCSLFRVPTRSGDQISLFE